MLSIGEISTLIAAAVFIARFVLPNVFALILVRLIGHQQNVTTWGFIQRSLSSTDWPIILQTDSIARSPVETKIRLLNWLQVATTAIVAFAAVLTPAGLYDQVRLRRQTDLTSFVRAYDSGPFGVGTQVQNEWPWRVCSDFYFPNDTILHYVNCPGSDQASTVIHNASGYYQDWEGPAHIVSVNESRGAIYQSGLQDLSPTVSSFFDIKPRRIARSAGDYNTRYVNYLPVESFHFVQGVVDQERYSVIEGLVVDAKDGGVGFRNHTLPQNTPLGAIWTEDLLFLEPDVAVVDLNLSFVWQIRLIDNNRSFNDNPPFSLVDDGGFANFDVALRPQYSDVSQRQLDLPGRAATTAWWTIYWTMKQAIMNLSDVATGEPDPAKSEIGQLFNCTDTYQGWTKTNNLGANTYPDLLLDNIVGYNGSENATQQMVWDSYRSFDGCSGWNESDLVHIDGIPIACSYLIGPPTLPDGSSFDFADEGVVLKRKLYAAASAVKLGIKTVEFQYNNSGETPIDGLRVLSIRPKNYSSPDDQPLWAVETPPLYQGNMQPLWGLVTDEYQQSENITTIRAPQLYPNYWPSMILPLKDDYTSSSYLPGSWALGKMLNVMAKIDSTDTSGSGQNSGSSSMLLLRRWQALSQTAEGATRIIKLMMTNMAANHLAGSRGWLSEGVVSPPFVNLTGTKETAMVSAYLSERVIRYHWPYAIPAFVALLLVTLATFVAVGFAATGSIPKISTYLSHLSAGRLLLDVMSKDQGDNTYEEDYKTWTKGVGRTQIPSLAWAQRDTVLASGSEKNEGTHSRARKVPSDTTTSVVTDPADQTSDLWMETRTPFLPAHSSRAD